MFVAEIDGLVEGRPGDSELALLAQNSLADRQIKMSLYFLDGRSIIQRMNTRKSGTKRILIDKRGF